MKTDFARTRFARRGETPDAPEVRKVLDCGSPLPLSIAGSRSKAAEVCRTPRRKRGLPAAFSLTELLVLIAILTLLAVTQLPALSRAKAPVKFTECMNKIRRIGMATMLYKDDNNDAFPVGLSIHGAASFGQLSGWPSLVLNYMGGYTSNSTAFVCPSEQKVAGYAYDPSQPFPFQGNFWANGDIIKQYTSDPSTTPPVRGSKLRMPSRYLLFGEKDPYDLSTYTPGALEQMYLTPWNDSYNDTHAMRRHTGGQTAAAADGHADWLRMPPYQPGRPSPGNFLELGSCVAGQPGTRGNWTTNGSRAKLWMKYAWTAISF